MQGGDISNQLPPRWIVVFEGVIGVHPTDADRTRYEWWAKSRAWKRAVDTFQLEPHASKVLWDMVWRRDMKFDVATFLPTPRAGRLVTDWLDRYNLPVSGVWSYHDPSQLGQQLAYLPDVYAVVHANENNRFTYGDRGMLVSQGWTI